jgi:hydroxypyruvate reductase
VEKYGLAGKLPKSVLERLKSGVEGRVPETPKPGDGCFSGTVHEIIASNKDAVKAALEVGKSHGLNVFVYEEAMEGETHETAIDFVNLAKRVMEDGKPVPAPALLISGGETTLEVKGGGMGGRNQEFVLTAAIEISGLKNVVVTSFGTDGIDGPTDAAGALADGFTLERAQRLGLEPNDHLERNDPYPFFKKLGDLLMTGPTGTNVMDVACLIVT